MLPTVPILCQGLVISLRRFLQSRILCTDPYPTANVDHTLHCKNNVIVMWQTNMNWVKKFMHTPAPLQCRTPWTSRGTSAGRHIGYSRIPSCRRMASGWHQPVLPKAHHVWRAETSVHHDKRSWRMMMTAGFTIGTFLHPCSNLLPLPLAIGTDLAVVWARIYRTNLLLLPSNHLVSAGRKDLKEFPSEAVGCRPCCITEDGVSSQLTLASSRKALRTRPTSIFENWGLCLKRLSFVLAIRLDHSHIVQIYFITVVLLVLFWDLLA